MTKIRAWPTLSGKPTRVIAHRGASGTLPEHTLEGYRLAIEQGADLIEPDLAITRDEVLIARHDRGLARSTDIAQRPEFAERARALPDGKRDWLVDDFTWAEVSRLRAVQPFPGRSKEYDGRLQIPRFAEVLELALNEGRRRGRWIGVYPEIKDPELFRQAGLDSTAVLIDELRGHKIGGEDAAVWVQCFESAPLVRVQEALELPVFELFDADASAAADFFKTLESRAPKVLAGIAVDKTAVTPQFARRVHDMNLALHAWTYRDDALPGGVSDPNLEYQKAFGLGIDALFSDFPATALASRRRYSPP